MENKYCNFTTSNKLPVKVIIIWLFVLIICYNLFQDNSSGDNLMIIPHTHLVDAIVFIAMANMAVDNMVDYSIASVRELGKWKGDIYIITDGSVDCFHDAVRDYEVKVIQVPKLNSIIEIKSLKPKLISLLPAHVSGALYIDVDILVTRNLAGFFKDLGSMIYFKQLEINNKQHTLSTGQTATTITTSSTGGIDQTAASATATTNIAATQDTLLIQPDFDFGAFLDAKGHYVGFCSGCEKWHSGVLWLRRGLGEKCLSKWSELLLSGKYETDQEALDYAEKVGSCPHSFSFPTRHLLFAKDYIGMILTSGQTFIHMTAASRPETQDYFYREIILPRIRNSLHPPLNPMKILQGKRKQCEYNSLNNNNNNNNNNKEISTT